eukprot:TRINITY_DN67631_c0_g1_i1.p1 TRINITY_DN67631_c0_g1~~TRINITY_DN67631_c0_g1_i1.p1  ORF type:complete len:175 (+),score=37.29 TRINITY_DN67631_c0_g1_i1:47-526(+)
MGAVVAAASRQTLREVSRYRPKDEDDVESLRDEDSSDEDSEEEQILDDGGMGNKKSPKGRAQKLKQRAALEEQQQMKLRNVKGDETIVTPFDEFVQEGYRMQRVKLDKWVAELRRESAARDQYSVPSPCSKTIGMPDGAANPQRRLHAWPAGGMHEHGN